MRKTNDVDNVGVLIIDRLVDEIYPLIRGSVTQIKSQRTMNARIGALTESLRKAAVDSSIGMFNGRAYIFTGKIYEPFRWEDLRNAVYEIMKMVKLDYSELNKYWVVSSACLEMIKSKQLVLTPNIVVFRNGVLKIDTNELIPHSKEFIQVSMCDFDFDPLAECNRWEKFLDQVLPVKAMQMVLQEYFGAIYLDRKTTKFEHMLILKGSGSNGKGVIFETITGIVGRENITNFGLDSLLTGADQKKNIALMNGKKLNYCSEIQALASGKYTDKLKALISGEPVEARALYGENFMACDLPLIVANCNVLPKLEDHTYGMQRRMIIIPFTKTIPVELQDTTLPVKIAQEYSGIFNWLMEGRARFVKRDYKFSRCEEIRQSVEEFAASASNTLQFMISSQYYPVFEHVEHLIPARITVKELYAEYVRWCGKARVKSKSQIMFSKELVDSGYTKVRDNALTYFYIYGEAASKILQDREREMERLYSASTTRTHKPFFIDGKMYGKGDWNASFYAHVSRPWLSTMRINGKLEGCYKYMGATPVYDIDALVKRVDKLGAYVDHDHKIKALAMKEEERMEAVTFNETMLAIGQPFRKWIHGMTSHSDRDIYVPNEWEFSEEAAAIALREHAEQQLKKIE